MRSICARLTNSGHISHCSQSSAMVDTTGRILARNEVGVMAMEGLGVEGLGVEVVMVTGWGLGWRLVVQSKNFDLLTDYH